MSEWLQPLTIGNLALENNLLQAPLAGYSSASFRLLCWRLGRPGLLASEMISAKALAMDAPRQEAYLARDPEEGPVAYQLWGREPDAVETAARIATDRGAAMIDLNCGCPVRKVRAAGAGSKLMEEPRLIGRLVAAMKRGAGVPVSVKIRIGPSADRVNAAEVARIVEAEGAALLTVHGRHARESYATPVRLERIAEVVDAVSVPVVGNGDVRDGASAARMFRETGCAGAMVARGCMGDPWVFARIRVELAGGVFVPPAPATVGEVLLEHYDRLAALMDPARAIRHARKLGAFYSRGIRGSKEFRAKLNHCHNRDNLAELIEITFGTGRDALFPLEREARRA